MIHKAFTAMLRLARSSRVVSVGFILLVVGLAIDLVYHGVLLTFWRAPAEIENGAEILGHLITFIGMNVMLAGILRPQREPPRALPSTSTFPVRPNPNP